jgi:hypothetical protein
MMLILLIALWYSSLVEYDRSYGRFMSDWPLKLNVAAHFVIHQATCTVTIIG